MLKSFLPDDNGLGAGRLHDVSGILHLANRGECSCRSTRNGRWIAARAEGVPMKATKIGASSLAEMKSFIAKRPV